KSVTVAIVLPVCVRLKGLVLGRSVHSRVVKAGLEAETLVGNALVSMYLKMGCVGDACKVFDEMSERDVVSWNALVAGLVENALVFYAFWVFKRMVKEGVWPNYATIANVLPVCGSVEGGYWFGKEIHCYAMRREELFCDVSVVNSLVGFYSKTRRMKEAESLFRRMSSRDLVSWNSMIAGYTSNVQLGADASKMCRIKEAHGFSLRSNLFPGNREPTLGNALIDAYARLGKMEYASKIFESLSGNRNVVTCNSLISGYVNGGFHDDAEIIFKNMTERDLTTWNLMVRAYAENGYFHQAIDLFLDLQNHGMKPDSMTIMGILPVANQMASIQMVNQCHGYAVRSCFQDVQLKGAFLDAYSKCGNINSACKLFESTQYKDLVMYTSMVGGYAVHGMGEEALQIYYKMVENGGKPDHVIITSILSACSHTGIEPTMEQYACVVDLLARNGRINDAYSFITSMPVEPTANVWGPLLGACKNYHDVEMGSVVADRNADFDFNYRITCSSDDSGSEEVQKTNSISENEDIFSFLCEEITSHISKEAKKLNNEF
ncbi:hypothetical protein M8C21_033986, partial [Ambrosia artemisiifolia]